MGGDFYCILEASESIGSFKYRRVLAELIAGLALTDTWQGNPTRNMHIHYSVPGAIQNEIIYATQELLARKLGVEVIVAPFTDHLAICLRISIALPIMRKGRGLWKMDSAVIIENVCTENFRTLWGCLQRQ